jgi:hypothetical protein
MLTLKAATSPLNTAASTGITVIDGGFPLIVRHDRRLRAQGDALRMLPGTGKVPKRL